MKLIPKINTFYVISFIVFFGMVVSALIVIRNVNKEYEIRQIAAEFQKYKYASLSFNNIYSGLPGDLDTATNYWPNSSRNGNGDRKITTENAESVLAWKHIQLSGLTEFKTIKFSGSWKDETKKELWVGFNSPVGFFNNTTFNFNYIKDFERNILEYVFIDPESKKTLPSITPTQSYSLDLMIDDGFPTTGNLRIMEDKNYDCFIAGEYIDDDKLKHCKPVLLF